MLIRFCILLFSVTILATNIQSQDVSVKKSEIIENIDGTDYYLHFVKKGETLFAIARAYDVAVNEIFKINPDSRKGIKPGTVLKIPLKKTAHEASTEEKTVSNNEFFYHIVKKQETLYSISKIYKVTISEIKSLNPGLSDYLQDGQTIQIPVIKRETAVSIENEDDFSTTHFVEKGETLYSIAAKYKVSTGEILNANPGITSKLDIGQKLNIPNQPNPEVVKAQEERKQEEKDYIFHTVAKGETLYSIAQTNGVNIEAITSINPGLTQYLAVGMEIKIPKSKGEKDYIEHKPERRESLVKIAELYKVDYEDVARLNPRISRKAKKGQSVKIPVEIEKEPEINQEEKIELETDDEIPYSPCLFPEKYKNQTYNIALMLPLFLEEVDSIEVKKDITIEDISAIPSLRFMDFYAGFKMAVDSMKNQGMKINLFIYDVDNNPEKAESVIFSSELSSMHLIVGPFYGKIFPLFADFAKTYQIPIINPLSSRTEVVNNNPFVFKVKPSTKKQIDVISKYIIDNYPGSNVLLIRGNKYKYRSENSYLRNTINKQREKHIYISNKIICEAIESQNKEKRSTQMLTENKLLKLEYFENIQTDSTWFSNLTKELVYHSDSVDKLNYNLSRIRKNIVVAMGDNIVYVKDLMSQLNKLSIDHDITLIGLPEWIDYDVIETQQKLNLNLHCFTSFLVDYSDEHVKTWIKQFREKYNTEPSAGNYAFDGFDIGWYFTNALYQSGPEFSSCLNYLNIDLIHTMFKFKQEGYNGYENIYWDLGWYNNYKFKKITVPDDIDQNTSYISQ